VAEYIIDKHGSKPSTEMGQGAKCIGGEIKVNSLERAFGAQTPRLHRHADPRSRPPGRLPDGALKEFGRHSRMGFIEEEGFYKEVERLRKLGFQRITLKTGAYGCASWDGDQMVVAGENRPLTIDGAPGGTA